MKTEGKEAMRMTPFYEDPPHRGGDRSNRGKNMTPAIERAKRERGERAERTKRL